MTEQIAMGIFYGVAGAIIIGIIGNEYLTVLKWRKQQLKDIKKSLRDIEFQLKQTQRDRASL